MASNSQFERAGSGEGGPIDCSAFESLLFDALDGTLTTTHAADFRQHATECGVCGPMFADVEKGYQALHSLEEVEPPDHLVHNILAKTAFADSGMAVRVPGVQPATGLWNRLRHGVLRP